MAFAPPRPLLRTIEVPERFFTLHSTENNVFALKLKVDTLTSVVGFRNWTTAHFIAQKLELNYNRTKGWPETDASRGSLHLPGEVSEAHRLAMIDIKEWDLEDLKYICTSNILDLISVEEIRTEGDNHLLCGNIYKFTAPVEFYQTRFNQILSLEQ